MTRMWRLLVCLVGLLASGTTAATAQEANAELRGRVLDAQGGVLPGVTITITNQATGVYRGTVSNEDGTYFVTALAPGMYAIIAELSGFKKYNRGDVAPCLEGIYRKMAPWYRPRWLTRLEQGKSVL